MPNRPLAIIPHKLSPNYYVALVTALVWVRKNMVHPGRGA
jgi:hypothetical protein